MDFERIDIKALNGLIRAARLLVQLILVGIILYTGGQVFESIMLFEMEKEGL